MSIIVYVINYELHTDACEYRLNRTSTLNEVKEQYFNINEIPNNFDKNNLYQLKLNH